MKKAELLMNFWFLLEGVLGASDCSPSARSGLGKFLRFTLKYGGFRLRFKERFGMRSAWVSPADFADLRRERFGMPMALVSSHRFHRFHRFEIDWWVSLNVLCSKFWVGQVLEIIGEFEDLSFVFGCLWHWNLPLISWISQMGYACRILQFTAEVPARTLP